jgi:hypothetical protein
VRHCGIAATTVTDVEIGVLFSSIDVVRPALGLGRIVVSEIEAPNMLAIPV